MGKDKGVFVFGLRNVDLIYFLIVSSVAESPRLPFSLPIEWENPPAKSLRKTHLCLTEKINSEASLNPIHFFTPTPSEVLEFDIIKDPKWPFPLSAMIFVVNFDSNNYSKPRTIDNSIGLKWFKRFSQSRLVIGINFTEGKKSELYGHFGLEPEIPYLQCPIPYVSFSCEWQLPKWFINDIVTTLKIE